MSESPGSPNIDKIRSQFHRQADAYIAQPSTHNATALQKLALFAGVKKSDLVLDIACGPGLFTHELSYLCAQATGLDATDIFLELARSRAQELQLGNITFEEGDVVHLPYPDAHFDLTTCRAAFHHFPDPLRVIVEMTRVTKPRGQLLIADLLGNADENAAIVHNSIETLCDPSHVHILSQQEFETLYLDAGLTLLQQITGPLTQDLETWIDHGGPPADIADQIRSRMTGWLENDAAGLKVARQGEQLQFVQQTSAFLLTKEA